MRLVGCTIAFVALAVPGAAAAEVAANPPSATDERRLSPEQVEAILADAAKKRQATESRMDPEAFGLESKPQVHGEVGVSVGTGGYRGAFGTAVYPLGDDGFAAISFDYVDWGSRRYRR